MQLSFDPISFLGITASDEEKREKLSKILMEEIARYLTVRILEILPEDKTEQPQDFNKLFSLAQKGIPDIEDKVKVFLKDFKSEFQERIKWIK